MTQIFPAKNEAQPPRRKHMRKMVCDVCGHQWQSYGYGVQVFCPKCYENRTGKKRGPSGEEMAKLRARRKCEQKKLDALPAPEPAPQQEGLFDRVFKWLIGGGER